MITKIDKLVFKGFIGPYIISFVVAEFVLVMQFLWKEIEDISGKGVGIFDILELMFYFSISLIPQAVPIAILLSSVFVFGNLSEKFELTSLKSAGVSLIRIMRMGIIMGVATMAFSLLASNYLVPKSNFVFFKRFYTIKKQKPALSIEAGMFNDDFNGYSIYAKHKDPESQTLEDVILYDQVNEESRYSMTSAKTGNMSVTSDGRFLEMELYEGAQYRELKESLDASKDPSKSQYPFMRTNFDKWQKFFDMSEFELDSNSVNVERKKYDMLNALQLKEEVDSLHVQIKAKEKLAYYAFNEIIIIPEDKLPATTSKDISKKVDEKSTERLRKQLINDRKKGAKKKPKTHRKTKVKYFRDSIDSTKLSSFQKFISPDKSASLMKSASVLARRRADQAKINLNKIRNLRLNESIYTFKMHSKFSWALICLIFLFIGAPFGSIIRKGGYGYPLLMSIVFFMVFILLAIMGEKLSRGGQMAPEIAAWLPCIVLLPFAIFFTTKALNDSSLKEFTIVIKLNNWWQSRKAKKLRID